VTNWLGEADGGFANNDANAVVRFPSSWHVAGTGDFNGDGRDDLLMRHDSGVVTNWLGEADGGFVNNDANAVVRFPSSWQVAGTGDFNGDGRDDLLMRHDSGVVTDWLGQADGGFVNNDANAVVRFPSSWHVASDLLV
jgi:hypothetical protein